MRLKRAISSMLMGFALLSFGVAAEAQTGVYAGIKVIDSIQNSGTMSLSGAAKDAFDPTQYGQNTIGGAIFAGYDFAPQMDIPVRAEIEYALRDTMRTDWNRAGGELKSSWAMSTLFANFYYDFHNSSAFTPYIGAGLGLAFVNHELEVAGGSNTTEMHTNFAWNAGLGCSYAFTENFSADLGYRFVSFGNTETSKTLNGTHVRMESTPYANEFSLGMRCNF